MCFKKKNTQEFFDACVKNFFFVNFFFIYIIIIKNYMCVISRVFFNFARV